MAMPQQPTGNPQNQGGCGNGHQSGQAFLTNSDLSFIAPTPSTLQSISWSPSTSRIFFTLVPTFTTRLEPFTFRSLITVPVSPSGASLPLESRPTLQTRASASTAWSPP